jgi:PAS domain S-box-containing protein
MSREKLNPAVRELIATVPETRQLPWWEWDLLSNRVTAGAQKITMLGYAPADFEGAGYQAYTALLHPEDYERTMQAMRDHLEGRAPLYEIDYRILRRTGDYTWYMDRGAILERTADGRPVLLRGVVLDLGPTLRDRAHDDAVVEAIRQTLSSESGAPMSVCAECGRLRYGEDEWIEITPDLLTGLSMEISHSLCPQCIGLLYPEIAGRVMERLGRGRSD